MKWEQHHVEQLRDLWHAGLSKSKIARRMGVSRGSIIGKSRTLNLHYRGQRKVLRLDAAHPAIREMRTLFPRSVRLPDRRTALLKPGIDTRKLGHVVAKGRWRGFPIYSLTLEERATCPAACKLLATCYGNRMHMARRWKHGPELEARLDEGLEGLQANHQRGFVLRLHILGDFYSPEYVELWRAWLKKFPALNVFGYTAWGVGTPIGQAIATLRNNRWDRFSVRTSGAKAGARTLVVTAADKAGDAIVCPAQTDDTTSCATCGLCWHTRKPVAFLEH